MQPQPDLPEIVGRYAIWGEIASGGMATVYYGRLLGSVGFSRTVAVKRLHGHFARDPDFVSMFLDEARLAARVRHPNVVQTLDVVSLADELLLVMEYIHGESLAQCLRAVKAAGQVVPLNIVSTILCGMLHGLHAAHEATTEDGAPLDIVHRDVGPQNLLVGADGVPRVLDFGVAKAVGRMQTTRDGQLKGKLAYMAPEQLTDGSSVDRRTDVYAAGVVLWETLTRQRLFRGENEGIVIRNVLERRVELPGTIVPGLPPELDAITIRALDRTPSRRFQTAREMALALEEAVPTASATRVAQWMEATVPDGLAERARRVALIERASSGLPSDPAMLTPSRMAIPAVARDTGSRDVGATLSQASSVSLAATRVRTLPPSRSWRSVPAGWAAGVLVTVVLCAVALARWTTPHAPSAASASSSADPPPADSALTSATADPSSVASPGNGEVLIIPAASVSGRQTTGPWRGGPSKPCPIRSYIDDQGIKHYVKDCK